MPQHDTEEDTGADLEVSSDEKEDAEQSHALSAVSVYLVVHEEGLEELNRPAMSLWWSGVAAGIGISASVLAEGILHTTFAGHAYRAAIENWGYTVGFVLVILGRLQLFTENTLTAILPLLSRRSGEMLWCTARLWSGSSRHGRHLRFGPARLSGRGGAAGICRGHDRDLGALRRAERL